MEHTQVAPLPSNRGVQNTSQHVLRACVDWVQVTFKNVQNLQKIYEILDIEESEFKDMSSSIYGYRSHKACGHISILYDGKSDMGIHVQMTGQGCREYEVLNKRNWKEFMMVCFENNGNFTRIDGAIDDICYGDEKPYFTLNGLYRKIKDGCVQSKFKKGKRVESFMIDDGKGIGETLYFGREQSDMQIRIYEKDYERLENGKELEEDLTAWNRTEIQCRRDRAQALALYILNNENFGEVMSGILKNYLCFKVKNPNETNKSRWKTCKWWDDFLGDVEPLKLTMIAPDRTIDTIRQWVDKQVAPSLATLFTATGGDTKMIIDLLDDGLLRMSEEQKRLASEAKVIYDNEKEEIRRKKAEIRDEYLFKTIRTHKIEKAHQPEHDQ